VATAERPTGEPGQPGRPGAPDKKEFFRSRLEPEGGAEKPTDDALRAKPAKADSAKPWCNEGRRGRGSEKEFDPRLKITRTDESGPSQAVS